MCQWLPDLDSIVWEKERKTHWRLQTYIHLPKAMNSEHGAGEGWSYACHFPSCSSCSKRVRLAGWLTQGLFRESDCDVNLIPGWGETAPPLGDQPRRRRTWIFKTIMALEALCKLWSAVGGWSLLIIPFGTHFMAKLCLLHIPLLC
jgi:hypothetical protein